MRLNNRTAARLMQGASRRLEKAVNRLLSGREHAFIAMFHDVVPTGAPLTDEFACDAAAFSAWLDQMQAGSWRFLSLDALLALPSGKRRKCCVLTFDDGFMSLHSIVQPLLASRGIPYTVYVASGYLGKPGYLDAAGLSALSGDPLCTVGAHSVSHPMFRFLPRAQAEAELSGGRAAISSITGRPVAHFAFPYGSAFAVSWRDIRLARRAGYSSAALTFQTPVVWLDRYRLPRINLPFSAAPGGQGIKE